MMTWLINQVIKIKKVNINKDQALNIIKSMPVMSLITVETLSIPTPKDWLIAIQPINKRKLVLEKKTIDTKRWSLFM
ncbi:hypothetical protein ACWM35_01500 [Neobacillus sp. K501]